MAVSAESTRAILRFKEPNFYIGPEDRSLFALCAATRVVDAEINLHDARNSAEIAKGAAGLDVQGFTYVKHRSALANSNRPSESWFEGQNLEDVYFPEVCKLICDLTGAKRAIVNNSAFRRKLANEQADPTHYLKRDCDLDKEIQKLPKDIPFGKKMPL